MFAHRVVERFTRDDEHQQIGLGYRLIGRFVMVRITGVDAGGIEELNPLPIVARHRIGTDIGIDGNVLLPRQRANDRRFSNYALPCSSRVPGLYCSDPSISNFPSISNPIVSWRLNYSRRERTSSNNALQSSSIFRSIPSSSTRRFQRVLTSSFSMFSPMNLDTSSRKGLNISLTRRSTNDFASSSALLVYRYSSCATSGQHCNAAADFRRSRLSKSSLRFLSHR